MTPGRSPVTIHLAKEIWFSRRSGDAIQFVALKDAAMAVDDLGKIIALGRANEFKSQVHAERTVDHGDGIIMPGFVDAHLHCPQIDVIGSGGLPLLEWLNKYVFPAEAKFKDQKVAQSGAKRLVRELKRHGVTTAAVFSSVHAVAAEALFSEFDAAGLRLISGKTSMDVGAPGEVLQPVRSDIEDQEALIKRWHGKAGRLFYAITPRFALSCSREMMRALGDLRERNLSCYVQSHISETTDEVAEVKKVWNGSKDYLAVYEDHGLLGAKTLLGHGIYLTDPEIRRMAATKTSVVHCPTSNSFLGSGLFNLKRTADLGARICLASDIGAGTGLSPWQTMLECYKVQALQGHRLTADELLYRATLAGAESLGLDGTCGSLEVGKDADFIVVNPSRNRLLSERIAVTETPAERLFACMAYGDDRIIEETYVAGQRLYAQSKAE